MVKLANIRTRKNIKNCLFRKVIKKTLNRLSMSIMNTIVYENESKTIAPLVNYRNYPAYI
ncbi:hypothetical protein HZS_6471 [Henneguya salminicola]|nr:hypothetical protein HZS_6471 [Henneguya salminicola]